MGSKLLTSIDTTFEVGLVIRWASLSEGAEGIVSWIDPPAEGSVGSAVIREGPPSPKLLELIEVPGAAPKGGEEEVTPAVEAEGSVLAWRAAAKDAEPSGF